MHSTEALLTVQETAAQLRVAPHTVRRAIRLHRLRALRPRGIRRVLVPASAIAEFLEAARPTTDLEPGLTGGIR
jgi:excisionase family DNA binding protein